MKLVCTDFLIGTAGTGASSGRCSLVLARAAQCLEHARDQRGKIGHRHGVVAGEGRHDLRGEAQEFLAAACCVHNVSLSCFRGFDCRRLDIMPSTTTASTSVSPAPAVFSRRSPPASNYVFAGASILPDRPIDQGAVGPPIYCRRRRHRQSIRRRVVLDQRLLLGVIGLIASPAPSRAERSRPQRCGLHLRVRPPLAAPQDYPGHGAVALAARSVQIWRASLGGGPAAPAGVADPGNNGEVNGGARRSRVTSGAQARGCGLPAAVFRHLRVPGAFHRWAVRAGQPGPGRRGGASGAGAPASLPGLRR